MDGYRFKKQFRGPVLSWWWPFIIMGIWGLLFYFVSLVNNALPTVVTLEEINENPSLFSGERSRQISRKLSSLGVRVVGSDENEIFAPQIIIDEVKEIERLSNSNQTILYEKQKGSGGYLLSRGSSIVNVYNNIQNVIVVVEGSEGSHSVLVNCHYDSNPSSPGASDDLISCSAMLEIIRILSISPTRLTHNIVFLFNGAEETILQGSHMFLSHKWAKNCKMVINLEAAGIGGRCVLFQSGPKNSWVLKYYAKYAKHPYGQIFGEELFQNGFIPSDSDFRIFRDFGKMFGLDFAFWQNGYVYHTHYDSERYIPTGSHQYLGDNILALVRAFGDAPEMNDVNAYSEGQMIYYDYLGWFMISYDTTINIIVNVLAMLLGLASIGIFVYRFYDGPTIFIEIAIVTCGIIIGMMLSLGVTICISVIVDAAATLKMPWYSNAILIFPMYFCPSLATYILVQLFINFWRASKHDMSFVNIVQMNLIASQIPWILIMFILTCIGARSASVLFLMIVITSLANLMIYATPLYKTGYSWIWIYLIAHIPMLIFNMYIVLSAFMFFMPIFGRSGIMNSDLKIGLITPMCMFLILGTMIPLVSLVKKPFITVIVLYSICILTIIVALTTYVGHPYKIDLDIPRPQRYQIQHSSREFRDENQTLRRVENGYFIYNIDPNSPRTLLIDHKEINYLVDDCQEEFYCGVPLYGSRSVGLSKDSNWVNGTAPILPKETTLILENNAPNCNHAELTCEYKFTLLGPDRMTLTFVPRPGASLKSWNLPALVTSTHMWKDRPTYFVHIAMGRVVDHRVTLKFKVTPEQLNGSPVMDIGLSGNFIHHEKYRTEDYKEFLKKVPDYATVISWISAHRAYVF